MGFVYLCIAIESDEKSENLMSGASNIIRSLLKVIGFIAFILPGANSVFSDNRIDAGGQGAVVRVEKSAAISDLRTQTTVRDAPAGRSNKSSSALTEAEP